MTNKNLELNTNKRADNLTKKSGRWSDLKNSFQDFWSEFRTVKYGIVGLMLLAIFLLLIVLEPFIIPFKEASSRWRDITYWEELPRNAAPAWSNWFTAKDGATQQILEDPVTTTKDSAKMKIIQSTFVYNYDFELPPSDMLYRAKGKGDITFSITLERPDGHEIKMARKTFKIKNAKDVKIQVAKEATANAFKFATKFDAQENISSTNREAIMPLNILFASAEEGILKDPKPLKGDYKIKISAVAMGKDSFLEEQNLVMAGRVYGILGTDSGKRDIWSGVISGIKWAMLIGLLTSCIAVTVGVLFGVTSAYFGGWIDSAMMRFFEVVASIPMLPVLIVMSAIFKPNIWILIIMMCVFSWTGSVRTVRSIGLQIKEETYVEAAHALDASNARIIFKHMIPQLIPYTFASMALLVPGAIVTEATVSLIGLGDASIVTWGQILHDAMSSSAVLKGLWWWVVPPGIFIALMGMTFAFLGFAMDTILNPKLRTR